ncbi:DUF7344 domain-containing protein [Halopelagius fulvigenes]|uniref:DUF7344 domain-containing protein n=1 Tax=Halopelagius fulvigenes TaxID=1198324 RepID=A0ABD5U571_9EURY
MTDTNDADRARPDFERWDYDSAIDAPPPDELFDALADATRRRTLWLLLDERRTTVEELADTLLGWRTAERGVVGADEREKVLLSLHHIHLPMLADRGLVAYDEADGDVRLPSLAEPVRDAIRLSYRYERATGASGSR